MPNKLALVTGASSGIGREIAKLAAKDGYDLLLVADAGRGLGHAFIDQDASDWRRVIDTNVTGTTYLLHRLGLL